MQSRKAREEELRRLVPGAVDLSQISDTELTGLISIALRKSIDKEERGDRPPRRRRRR